ncbi:MAG: hypothetical protein LIP02_07925 [Bacteroidales bacterium]|nr:hypothetical protein [Bacteroidales bacterium]
MPNDYPQANAETEAADAAVNILPNNTSKPNNMDNSNSNTQQTDNAAATTQGSSTQRTTTSRSSSTSTNNAIKNLSRADKRLLAGKAKVQFLQQLNWHQADAMKVVMNIAQGKSDPMQLDVTERQVLNDYLNGSYKEDTSLTVEERVKRHMLHRNTRARALLQSMGDVLNQTELNTASSAMLVVVPALS